MSGDHLKPDTQLIKHSVALRAKYASKKHLGPIHIHCMEIVPHPSSRNGNAIPVARTQQLGGMIAYYGYDQFEANLNGICVELGPGVDPMMSNRFDAHFNTTTGMDLNHAFHTV